jgi:hypothetical protein
MAEQTPKYLSIGNADHPVTVWWAPQETDRVHLTTGDPRFTDEAGGRLGLQVVFSSNPKSADYNPGNFNRVARALADAGIPAPPEVPVHRRHLRYRSQVMADVAAAETATSAAEQLGEEAIPEAGAPGAAGQTDPAEFGWGACDKCKAVVVDLEGHVCAA